MGKSYRVLIAKQDTVRAEAIERELDGAGIPCRADRAASQEEFLAQMERATPDVILADYSSASFEGLSALDLAQRKHPGVPFIFVDDPPGEERALDAVHRGAADFVLTSHLSRLGPAITRALKKRTGHGTSARIRTKAADASLVRLPGVVMWEADPALGRFLEVSPEAEPLLGYPVRRWLTPTFLKDCLHPEDRDRVLSSELKAVVEKGRHAFDGRLRASDGRFVWLRGVARRSGPEAAKAQGLFIEIADPKKGAGGTSQAEAQLSEMTRYHDVVTHDISNYTMVMLGIVERLLARVDGPLNRKQEAMLLRANRKSLEMNRLADNARLFARLQKEDLPAAKERVPMVKVLRDVVKTARSLHFDRPFEFSAECPTDLSVSTLPFLETVLLNLIDNAVRTTVQENKPSVRIQVRRDDEMVHIAIQGGEPSGDGAGAKLFERDVRSSRPTGADLGLALTREIVQRAGGRIQARTAAVRGRDVYEVCVTVPRGDCDG